MQTSFSSAKLMSHLYFFPIQSTNSVDYFQKHSTSFEILFALHIHTTYMKKQRGESIRNDITEI